MLLLAAPWLHNLDPFAIQIPWFPGGGIRWYGLSYLAGFLLGFLLIKRVLIAGVSPLEPKQAADLVVTIAIGIVLGGRLGYVLFYKPELIIDFTPEQLPYWGVLKINQGGMASHGGMLGGAAGCLFFAWRQRVGTLHMIDLMSFGAPLGLLMGRIANFINGELYGRACAFDYPLAVQFPQEMYDAWTAEQFEQMSRFAQSQGEFYTSNGQMIDAALTQAHAGDPAWIAFFQTDLTPRYPSQLFAGVTEGLIVFAVLLVLYRKPVRPGLIGGAFCITYALMRVVNEFFRLPDQHLMADGQLPLITRGQVLSFGLLLLGVLFIYKSVTSKGDKLGGWIKAPRSEKSSQSTQSHKDTES